MADLMTARTRITLTRAGAVLVCACLLSLGGGLSAALDPRPSDQALAAPQDKREQQRKKARKLRKRPNVILVVSDDQTLDQYRPETMPFVTESLGGNGTTFTNAFATSPVCCPSRASMLTGQYPHNHGVLSNVSGYKALQGKRSTLPVWLTEKGYATAHVGKYLNGYAKFIDRKKEKAPGWKEWHTALDNRYYDYDFVTNGRVGKRGERRERLPRQGDHQEGRPRRSTGTSRAAARSTCRSTTTPPTRRAGARRTAAVPRVPTRTTRTCSPTSRCHSRRASTRRTSTTSRPSSAGSPNLDAEESRQRRLAVIAARSRRCARSIGGSSRSPTPWPRGASWTRPRSCSPPTTATSMASTGCRRKSSRPTRRASGFRSSPAGRRSWRSRHRRPSPVRWRTSTSRRRSSISRRRGHVGRPSPARVTSGAGPWTVGRCFPLAKGNELRRAPPTACSRSSTTTSRTSSRAARPAPSTACGRRSTCTSSTAGWSPTPARSSARRPTRRSSTCSTRIRATDRWTTDPFQLRNLTSPAIADSLSPQVIARRASWPRCSSISCATAPGSPGRDKAPKSGHYCQ